MNDFPIYLAPTFSTQLQPGMLKPQALNFANLLQSLTPTKQTKATTTKQDKLNLDGTLGEAQQIINNRNYANSLIQKGMAEYGDAYEMSPDYQAGINQLNNITSEPIIYWNKRSKEHTDKVATAIQKKTNNIFSKNFTGKNWSGAMYTHGQYHNIFQENAGNPNLPLLGMPEFDITYTGLGDDYTINDADAEIDKIWNVPDNQNWSNYFQGTPTLEEFRNSSKNSSNQIITKLVQGQSINISDEKTLKEQIPSSLKRITDQDGTDKLYSGLWQSFLQGLNANDGYYQKMNYQEIKDDKGKVIEYKPVYGDAVQVIKPLQDDEGKNQYDRYGNLMFDGLVTKENADGKQVAQNLQDAWNDFYTFKIYNEYYTRWNEKNRVDQDLTSVGSNSKQLTFGSDGPPAEQVETSSIIGVNSNYADKTPVRYIDELQNAAQNFGFPDLFSEESIEITSVPDDIKENTEEPYYTINTNKLGNNLTNLKNIYNAKEGKIFNEDEEKTNDRIFYDSYVLKGEDNEKYQRSLDFELTGSDENVKKQKVGGFDIPILSIDGTKTSGKKSMLEYLQEQFPHILSIQANLLNKKPEDLTNNEKELIRNLSGVLTKNIALRKKGNTNENRGQEINNILMAYNEYATNEMDYMNDIALGQYNKKVTRTHGAAINTTQLKMKNKELVNEATENYKDGQAKYALGIVNIAGTNYDAEKSQLPGIIQRAASDKTLTFLGPMPTNWNEYPITNEDGSQSTIWQFTDNLGNAVSEPQFKSNKVGLLPYFDEKSYLSLEQYQQNAAQNGVLNNNLILSGTHKIGTRVTIDAGTKEFFDWAAKLQLWSPHEKMDAFGKGIVEEFTEGRKKPNSTERYKPLHEAVVAKKVFETKTSTKTIKVGGTSNVINTQYSQEDKEKIASGEYFEYKLQTDWEWEKNKDGDLEKFSHGIGPYHYKINKYQIGADGEKIQSKTIEISQYEYDQEKLKGEEALDKFINKKVDEAKFDEKINSVLYSVSDLDRLSNDEFRKTYGVGKEYAKEIFQEFAKQDYSPEERIKFSKAGIKIQGNRLADHKEHFNLNENQIKMGNNTLISLNKVTLGKNGKGIFTQKFDPNGKSQNYIEKLNKLVNVYRLRNGHTQQDLQSIVGLDGVFVNENMTESEMIKMLEKGDNPFTDIFSTAVGVRLEEKDGKKFISYTVLSDITSSLYDIIDEKGRQNLLQHTYSGQNQVNNIITPELSDRKQKVSQMTDEQKVQILTTLQPGKDNTKKADGTTILINDQDLN